MSGPAEFAELQPSDSPVLDDWAETEFPLARPPQIGFLDATLQLEAGAYDLWIGQSSDLPLHIYTLDIMKL